MAFKSGPGFQGHAYIILQVIRACNIAVLFAVIFTSGLMMAFAKMPNGFQFFDDVSHAFVVAVAGLLIWSELPIEKGQALIRGFWPVLGPNHGFTWLGVSMILMGSHLLGALSDDTYTNEHVPFQIWQVIMGSGIIAIAFGVTNVVASIIFRNRKNNYSAREVRDRGATNENAYYANEYDSYRSNSIHKEKPSMIKRISTMAGLGSKPKISHPIPQDVESGAVGDEHTAAEDRGSPIVPGIQRPPTAMHPAYNRESRSSRYSEASHLKRWGEMI
ncbi:hypothetical protein GGS23DRAFT_605662 [Durotheca rogersii]|uniref:uncharacterized protein n=1 Tax=Durotheca rogersii TaxID=419775 RepID=UPI00221F4DEE|nr:uncharacterized protein GGS23DRAFT_605662 [Durotheca rogersii]KAI5862353.1 hypothetical protein GGS23DRAFT_605662 [Durotheca rogersii]